MAKFIIQEKIVSEITKQMAEQFWERGALMKNLADNLMKENEIFEKSLRENAEPKVKGEITKGKIKWRGIRIIQQNKFLKSAKWLEQRGKQISPKITFEASINI